MLRNLWSLVIPFALVISMVSVGHAGMTYVDVCDSPKACLKFSRLIMGTDHLGQIPNEQAIQVLNEAVALGINVFDTAPIYTNSIEGTLGQWLESLNRDDLYVITKGGFPHDIGPGSYDSRLKGQKEQIIANIKEEIIGSYQRLNHKIAIYLMHRDDVDFMDYKKVDRPATSVTTILEALSDPELRGLFTMVGVSNWRPERVNESQIAAHNNPQLVRPVASSPYFSILEMDSVTIHSGGVQATHAEMMDPDYQKGVKMMTYSPLGGFSIFSKTWQEAKARALELKTQGDRYWGNVYESIFHNANEQRFRRVISFAEGFNEAHSTSFTPDQVANAYVLAHERADFLVIGPRSVDQLRRTVGSLELARMLTREDLDFLYDNSRPPAYAKKKNSRCLKAPTR